MYFKSLPFLLGFFLFSKFTFAQPFNYNQRPEFLKANSVWVFGLNHGLDFNSGIPTPFSSAIAPTEGCASVADPVTGKLLFYSNGGEVYDANHVVMPNGDSLLGNRNYSVLPTHYSAYSTKQAVCIVPVLESPQKYYLFTLSGYTSNKGIKPKDGSLFYSIIDMTLNNGFGDVVPGQKNIPVDTNYLSEGVIAVPGDNCNVWLILHHRDSSEFRVYSITRDGIDENPVKSFSIANRVGRTSNFAVSAFAVSPDRKRVAMTLITGFLIADFNPLTGEVSNALEIDNAKVSVYSGCFSPDNSKLYFSDEQGLVFQYDLSVYNAGAISNSRIEIVPIVRSTIGSIPKLYNDTIYIYHEEEPRQASLLRINKPNLPGVACDPQRDAIILPVATTNRNSLALNNDVVFAIPKSDTIYNLAMDSTICESDFITINASDGAIEYIWENGDTAMTRRIGEAGVYWVMSKDFCETKIDTFIINTMDLDPFINVNGRILGTTASYYGYQWMLNGSLIPGATDSFYVPQRNGDYQVIVSNEKGCVDTAAIYKVTNVDEGSKIDDLFNIANQISIYPNPATDFIHIITPVAVYAEMYSIEGRKLFDVKDVEKINIAQLNSGLYFLKIYDAQGRLLRSEKVVKE